MTTSDTEVVHAEEVSDPSCMQRRPLVSVLMMTYNHVHYLPQAIEGVLAQRCDFDVELLIGEDASTDGTLGVALAYQRRHPETIRVVCSRDNVGAYANIRRLIARARGRYVAWCEGDDYWCLPEKLQAQVNLIEGCDHIGVVHSDWTRAYPREGGWRVDWAHPVHRRVPLDRLQGDLFRVFHYPKILRTCTRLARRDAVLECMHSALGEGRYRFGDTVLAACLTSRWKVAYLPRVTAVYRLSPDSALRSGRRSRVGFMRSGLAFDDDARRFFRDRPDYPLNYRWELAAGLALWGAAARDAGAVREAVSDMRHHFGPGAFMAAAWQTLRMRRPLLVPRREPPSGTAAVAS